MIILLFGVSNVGKTTTGKLLAKQLNYGFFDLDDEVKKKLNITLETFVSRGTLYERDQIRCQILLSLVAHKGNKIIAITPLSYTQTIQPLLSAPSVFAIELVDSPAHIFDRLVFSDENDVIYKDDIYKNKHKAHYIEEIQKDLEWYGSVYRDIKHHFYMDGLPAKEVVQRLITKYQLTKTEV